MREDRIRAALTRACVLFMLGAATSGCGPGPVRTPPPVYAGLPQSFAAGRGVEVQVHANLAGHVGYRLQGLAHVQGPELRSPDLAGAVAEHVVAAAERVGFRPGSGATRLVVDLPIFEVQTAGSLAGSTASAWLRGRMSLTAADGSEIYTAPLEGTIRASENNSPALGFELLDHAVEQWFTAFSATLAQQPELMARLSAQPGPTVATTGVSAQRDVVPEGVRRADRSRSQRPGRVFVATLMGWVLGNALTAGVWAIKSAACDDWRVGISRDGSLGCDLSYALSWMVAQGVGGSLGVALGGGWRGGMGGSWRTYLLGISGSFLGSVALPNPDEDGRVATIQDFDAAFVISAFMAAPMAEVGYEIDSGVAEARARSQRTLSWAPTLAPTLGRDGHVHGLELGLIGAFF
ncbi:MAG: hypothetical protein GW913_07150 [Myxococcales bacterium]|nr:hypothetical protein [Myxococcales bacterium]